MTDTSNPDDPLAALEAAARQALIGRPTPPTRTQFLRLCIDQVERCQALGWSAADFASVLSKHMPMTARQFTGALRGARSTAGQWGRQRGSKAGKQEGATTNAGNAAGKWDIPGLKKSEQPERFGHNPTPNPDLLKGKK